MNLNILKIPSDHNGEMSGHLSFSVLANNSSLFSFGANMLLPRDGIYSIRVLKLNLCMGKSSGGKIKPCHLRGRVCCEPNSKFCLSAEAFELNTGAQVLGHPPQPQILIPNCNPNMKGSSNIKGTDQTNAGLNSSKSHAMIRLERGVKVDFLKKSHMRHRKDF